MQPPCPIVRARPQHVVQGRPADTHERAHRRPQAAEVDITQRIAVLVVISEPADDDPGPLDGGADTGTEAAKRPHGVGLHRQAGPGLIPAGAALGQLDLPGALAQGQVEAQAGDAAADDEHPLRSQRRPPIR
jgi:hypothetical protein